MGRIDFHLEFLDDVVRTLMSLASNHDDMSRTLASSARTAQARGGSSWVSDQLRYASSVLAGHRDSLQDESARLKDRLVIARSTAEGWDGNQAELRAAIAGIMAPVAAVAVAKQIGGSSGVLAQSVGVLSLAKASGMASLTNAAGEPRSNDCVQYVTAVMQKMGITKRPGDGGGDIYTSAGWTGSGFTHVASVNSPIDTSASAAVQRATATLNAAAPTPGSFFEMGQNGDTGPHHAGIYLGSKGGVAYIAQSNWPIGQPPGIFRVGTDGNPHSLSTAEVKALSTTSLGSDVGAKAALSNMWAGGVPGADNVINFYAPPSK
jgi:hypothetical protein